MNKKCLRRHGDEFPQNRIVKFCTNPDCEIKLACGECQDDYHLNHKLFKISDFHSFYISNQPDVTIDQQNNFIFKVNTLKKEMISQIEDTCNRILLNLPKLTDYSQIEVNNITDEILNDILNQNKNLLKSDILRQQFRILEELLSLIIDKGLQLDQNIDQSYLPQIQLDSLYTSEIIQQTSKECQEFFQTQILQKLLSVKQSTLLFSGSRDGLFSEELRMKCSNKNNLIFLILSEHGQVLGGYTPLKFNDYGKQYIGDPTHSTFIFSITKCEYYPLLADKDSLSIDYQEDGTQIGFGWQDLSIHLFNKLIDSNTHFPTIRSEFPRNFAIDQYPDSQIPKNSWQDKTLYLLNTRHQSRIIDLEVFEVNSK